MKYLFDEWKGLSGRIRDGRIFLFLDYDGTLAPIADKPELAAFPEDVKAALEALVRDTGVQAAIISGRALDDLKRRVGLEGVIYVGNHGLEMYDSKLYYRWMMPPRFKDALAEIKNKLSEHFAKMAGILIEDKGFTLSFHYRLARIEEAVVKKEFDNILAPYLPGGEIRVAAGKKVFEVRPLKGGRKGGIVKELLLMKRNAEKDGTLLPIYIGDDETDEDAFKEVNGEGGVTIRVGAEKGTLAGYYLRNTDEVTKLLNMIATLRKGG